MGKKLGIATLICTIIYVISSIIIMTQAPDIPDEYFELMLKDSEAAQEMLIEISENASPLFNVASSLQTITGLVGIILAIASIVKLVKEKQKGTIIPILCIILIIVLFVVSSFSALDFDKAFMAGFNAGMNNVTSEK